jgi:centrosomal protein CEP120
MESETGLKALFASAKDYEEEETAKREAAASKAAMEAAVRAIEETGAGARGGEGGGAAAAPASPARTSGKPPRSPKKSPKPVTAASLAEKRAQEKEVRRLVAERAELMGTGAYSSADRVIAIIDEKIADLTSAVAGG